MPTLAPGVRQIDLGNPVANVPLNSGLRAWYLPLPNKSGGQQLYDLTGSYPGTPNSGVSLVPATRPGRTAQMTSFASGQVPHPTGLNLSVFTLCAWVYATSISSYRCIWANGSPQGFYNQGGTLDWYQGGDHQPLAPTVAANTWTQVGVKCDGTNLSFYTNGQFLRSLAFAAVFNDVSGGIGSDSGGNNWAGLLDGITLHDRVLSDGEMFLLYAEGLTGYPTTIRRFTPATRVFGGTSTSPPPSGRLSRPCSLDGLGGAGQQSFNPSLGV